MRIGPYARVLLILVVVLVGISLYAMEQAFYWRGLYHSDPRVRVEQRDNIVYAKFNPNRSVAYTCTIQKVSAEGVGMVCNSPDGDVSINCTTTPGRPDQYFC